MRGQVTSEKIHKIIADNCDLDFTFIFERFVSHVKRLKVHCRQELVDLKKEYCLGLITTNVDAFSRFTVPSKKLDQHFDLILNSADLGFTKETPGGEIFKIAGEILDCDLKEMTLIDDSVKVGKIFHELGGRFIQIRSPQETSAVLRNFAKQR